MAKARLTMVFAMTAKPGLYWDTHELAPRGFLLQVTNRGSRAYRLNYRRQGDGVERRLTIGDASTWPIWMARMRAAELRRIVDNGGDPLEEKQDAMGKGRPKRGDNSIIIFAILAKAGIGLRPTDLRKIAQESFGVTLAYTSIRHALHLLQKRNLVDHFGGNYWRLRTPIDDVELGESYAHPASPPETASPELLPPSDLERLAEATRRELREIREDVWRAKNQLKTDVEKLLVDRMTGAAMILKEVRESREEMRAMVERFGELEGRITERLGEAELSIALHVSKLLDHPAPAREAAPSQGARRWFRRGA